jgi:excisionase family DNA binding protein
MDPKRELPPLITTKELARLLQVSTRTVWRWLKAGALPPLRMGGSVRWRLDVVNAWITGDRNSDGKPAHERLVS